MYREIKNNKYQKSEINFWFQVTMAAEHTTQQQKSSLLLILLLNVIDLVMKCQLIREKSFLI